MARRTDRHGRIEDQDGVTGILLGRVQGEAALEVLQYEVRAWHEDGFRSGAYVSRFSRAVNRVARDLGLNRGEAIGGMK